MSSLALLNIREGQIWKVLKCIAKVWLEGKITSVKLPLCMTSHDKGILAMRALSLRTGTQPQQAAGRQG